MLLLCSRVGISECLECWGSWDTTIKQEHEANEVTLITQRRKVQEKGVVGSLSWADETTLFAVRPTLELFQRHLAVGNWRKPTVKSFKILFGCEQCRCYCLTRSSPQTPSRSVDVIDCGDLRTGSYCLCWFQDKIIPPDPITQNEKKQTLQRLNQVIQYRLVSSELPTQMRRLKIGTPSAVTVFLSACLSHSLCV